MGNFFLLQCLEEVKIDLLFVFPGLYYIYKNTLYYPIFSLNLYYIPYFSSYIAKLSKAPKIKLVKNEEKQKKVTPNWLKWLENWSKIISNFWTPPLPAPPEKKLGQN